MVILGINAYHPDSSAALVVEGKLIAACEEERLRRIKHFAGFPKESIQYCLKEAGISIKDVDYLALARNPSVRLLKKFFYGLKIPTFAKRRLAVLKKTLDIKHELSQIFDIDEKKIKARTVKVEHHRAHIGSSFFTSGFERAFLFSMDALGDFASTMWALGEGNQIKILGEITFPHSLGFYYTAITQYLGFLNFGDEYKVMGLAPYGEATYEDEFKKILKIQKNRFTLDLNYFLHHKKYIDLNFENGYPKIAQIFSSYLEKRLGEKRAPHEPLKKRHKDIAFCLQKRLEEVVSYLINTLSPSNISNLCLTGGVSQNCVVNGKLFKTTQFKKIYVPPAPGDAGLSVGAAFYVWNQIFNQPRTFFMNHAYWGPEFEEEAIKLEVKKQFNEGGYTIEKIENEDALIRRVALEISKGKVTGWFKGRMEFGPRALGNRSILADPRREKIRDILNERIKYRELFRPFALSILEEETGKYFEHSHPSNFMSFVYKIKEEKRKKIAAVVHYDGTARLQTVNKDANPLYWKLINEFKKISGVPILLNTSFNENEPIVCSPKEAIDCFLRTKMDVLVLGNVLIIKREIASQ